MDYPPSNPYEPRDQWSGSQQVDFEIAGGPAWEFRDQLGGFSAAVRTVKEVLFDPGATFAAARCRGGLGAPLLFSIYMNVIFGVIAAMIGVMLQTSVMDTFNTYLEQLAQNIPASQQKQEFDQAMQQWREMMEQVQHQNSGFNFFFTILYILMISTVFPFISAVIVHFAIMVVGGARRDFEATFRVCAYCAGAAAVLKIIPFCGPVILYHTWRIGVLIVGIREMHRIEGWRAGVGVLWPHLVFWGCCCCLPLLALFMLAASAPAP